MPIRDERLKRVYLDENVTCELSPWLRCCRNSVGVDPHHILGGPFRDDVVTNLVAVCRSAHSWVQAREIVAGRVLCLWVKWMKKELDWGHWVERDAGCQVAWIESRPIKGRVLFEGRDITAQVQTWRAELLRDGMRWWSSK